MPNGEWWIDDSGDATFADGDVGDANHAMIAFEYAIGLDEETINRLYNRHRIEICMYGGWNDEKIALLYAEENPEVAEQVRADIEAGMPEVHADKWFEENGANMDFIRWWRDGGNDPRDYQIETNNWIRVHGNNFQMWTFDDEALDRIRNASDIWGEEDDVGVPWEQSQEYVYIEEESTGKSFGIEAHALFNLYFNAAMLKRIGSDELTIEEAAREAAEKHDLPPVGGTTDEADFDQGQWRYRRTGDNPPEGEYVTLLSEAFDPASLSPGTYAAVSTQPAYNMLKAMITAGHAKELGQKYIPEGALVVTAQIGDGYVQSNASQKMRLGPAFFKNAIKDYENWPVKWWREVIQNSVDAGAKHISLYSTRNEENPDWQTVICGDDGKGMSLETILDKFLVLGATTKEGDSGAAGGFGKAKELILLPWLNWYVYSRDNLICGSGDSYTIWKLTPAGWTPHETHAGSEPEFLPPSFIPTEYGKGTVVAVIMSRDNCTTAASALEFVELSYLPKVSFKINGDEAKADLKAKKLVQSVPGKVDIYYNKEDRSTSKLIVRAKGLFMFDIWLSNELKGRCIAEITGNSVDLLAANRDGFRDYSTRYTVQDFANKVAADTMQATRTSAGMVREIFRGKGKIAPITDEAARMLAESALQNVTSSKAFKLTAQQLKALAEMYKGKTTVPGRGPVILIERRAGDEQMLQEVEASGVFHPSSGAQPAEAAAAENIIDLTSMSFEEALNLMQVTFQGPAHFEAAIKQLVWKPDFYLINEIEGFRISKKFKPATMTPTVLRLVKVWTELCRYVLIQLGCTRPFGVGLIFSSDSQAAYLNEKSEEWLLLNPIKAGEDRLFNPRDDADLKRLYSYAIHECTHLHNQIYSDGRSFSTAFTDNVATCADGYRFIRKIARAIKVRGATDDDSPLGSNPDDDEYEIAENPPADEVLRSRGVPEDIIAYVMTIPVEARGHYVGFLVKHPNATLDDLQRLEYELAQRETLEMTDDLIDLIEPFQEDEVFTSWQMVMMKKKQDLPEQAYGRREMYQFIYDWYIGANIGQNIRLYRTLRQAMDAAEAWHTTCNVGGPDEYLRTKDENIVYEWEDGWTIQLLTEKHDFEVESNKMGHCVGRAGYYDAFKRGETKIYSLRDPQNDPHATIQMSLGVEVPEIKKDAVETQKINVVAQVKGKQNKPVIKKYKERLVDFLAGMYRVRIDSIDNRDEWDLPSLHDLAGHVYAAFIEEHDNSEWYDDDYDGRDELSGLGLSPCPRKSFNLFMALDVVHDAILRAVDDKDEDVETFTIDSLVEALTTLARLELWEYRDDVKEQERVVLQLRSVLEEKLDELYDTAEEAKEFRGDVKISRAKFDRAKRLREKMLTRFYEEAPEVSYVSEEEAQTLFKDWLCRQEETDIFLRVMREVITNVVNLVVPLRCDELGLRKPPQIDHPDQGQLEFGENPSIQFTPEKFKAFKRAYAAAVKRGDESFVFEGQEVLVAYAKYVIEYLEQQFGSKNPPGDDRDELMKLVVRLSKAVAKQVDPDSPASALKITASLSDDKRRSVELVLHVDYPLDVEDKADFLNKAAYEFGGFAEYIRTYPAQLASLAKRYKVTVPRIEEAFDALIRFIDAQSEFRTVELYVHNESVPLLKKALAAVVESDFPALSYTFKSFPFGDDFQTLVIVDEAQPEVIEHRLMQMLEAAANIGVLSYPEVEQLRMLADDLMYQLTGNDDDDQDGDDDDLLEMAFNPSVEDYLRSIGVSEDVIQAIAGLDKEIQKKVVGKVRKQPDVTLEQLHAIIEALPRKRELSHADLAVVRRIIGAAGVNPLSALRKWFEVQLLKNRLDEVVGRNDTMYGRYSTHVIDPEEQTTDRMYLNAMAEHLVRRLIELRDWLNATHADIHNYTWQEAVAASDAWHEAQAAIGDEYGPTDPQNIVFQYPDGWTIQAVTTQNDLLAEGNKMRHCVGSYWKYVEKGELRIFSLRDPKNHPHVTMEVEPESWYFKQITGTANSEPKEEYVKRLREWILTLSDATREDDSLNYRLRDADLNDAANLMRSLWSGDDDRDEYGFKLDASSLIGTMESKASAERPRDGGCDGDIYDAAEALGRFLTKLDAELVTNIGRGVDGHLKAVAPLVTGNDTRTYFGTNIHSLLEQITVSGLHDLWKGSERAISDFDSSWVDEYAGHDYPREDDFESKKDYEKALEEYEEAVQTARDEALNEFYPYCFYSTAIDAYHKESEKLGWTKKVKVKKPVYSDDVREIIRTELENQRFPTEKQARDTIYSLMIKHGYNEKAAEQIAWEAGVYKSQVDPSAITTEPHLKGARIKGDGKAKSGHDLVVYKVYANPPREESVELFWNSKMTDMAKGIVFVDGSFVWWPVERGAFGAMPHHGDVLDMLREQNSNTLIAVAYLTAATDTFFMYISRSDDLAKGRDYLKWFGGLRVTDILIVAADENFEGTVGDFLRATDTEQNPPSKISLAICAAMQEIKNATYPNPFNEREMVFNDEAAFELDYWQETLHLKSLRAFKRRQHAGTRAMEFLVEIADKHGVPMSLIAEPYGDEKISAAALERFYRRFGFEENQDMGMMVRQPRVSNPALV